MDVAINTKNSGKERKAFQFNFQSLTRLILLWAISLSTILAFGDTIFYDGFEGAFPGSWVVGNNSGITTAKWGDNYAKYYAGSWSAFCADNGSDSRTTYDNNLNTYMQRQGISLVGYTSATLTFKYWMHTEVNYDGFEVNVRDQSGNWHNVLSKYDGGSSSWQTGSINLNSYCGQSNIYISFDFVSDSSVVPSGQAGVWLDEVSLTATPAGVICPSYDAVLTPTTSWQTYSSSIASNSWKLYRISLTAGTPYIFKTGCDDGATASFDTVLELANSSCSNVASDDDGCESNRSKIEYTPTSSGYYYLKVRGFSGASGTFTLAYKSVGEADLALMNLSVTRPANSALRTFTACGFDIRNNGPIALSSEGIMVDYYLSDDIAFGDADDRKIGDTGFTVSIASGAIYPISLNSVGLSNMVRDWVPGLVSNGNYYVFAKVRITDGFPVDPTPNNDMDRTDSTFPYTGEINLQEAIDFSTLPVVTGTSAKWFGQDLTYYYDGDAAQSSDIDDGGESYMYITVNGPGIIRFYWSVSSENGWDYLQFYNDSTVLEQISGTVGWTSKEFSIESGSHTLKWRYMKDGSGSIGSDCGWVDYVRWDETPPPQGEIHGSKWNDLDGDGNWDGGESGLSDWKIYIDENGNGQWDSGEPYDWTGADGSYSFTNLEAGTYVVGEVPQEGWVQTYPAPSVGSSEEISRLISEITTTASTVPIYTYGEVVEPEPNQILPLTAQSGPLINMDDFRADPRFSGIDGSGYAVVILDTGIDLDHPYFGPDNDSDGIADRIVFQHDFADGDDDASDQDNHGSNVSSIIGSQDSIHTGMAPAIDIIHLKVFTDGGAGNFDYVEQALQWVVNNAAAYNVVSINMSLGDNQNWTVAGSHYGLGDELATLEAMGIIVVSASGNDFFTFSSQQGVAYPSADPSSLSIGAVYDAATGSWSYSSGAIANSSGTDRITPFSQRHTVLTTIFAPGAVITGANQNGGTVSFHGTSQASPHIAGIIALTQQLAENRLGRWLTRQEFIDLLRNTAVTINDGDDEDDNVINTNLNFPRVNMLALAEGILSMGGAGMHTVVLDPGEIASNIDFGNRVACISPQITDQPDSQTVCVGQDAVFSIAATGTEPLHYQWKKDGSDVGTDSATLILSNVQLEDNGSQVWCDVSNGCGSPATSSPATLTVYPWPTVTINPNPDQLNASWTLNGPNGYIYSSNGDQTLSGLEFGNYEITWDAIPDWNVPAPNPDTKTLSIGNSINFVGNYQLIADFNNDYRVNFVDFATLASHWMGNCTELDWCNGADVNHSGSVGTDDLLIMAEYWLEGTEFGPADMVWVSINDPGVPEHETFIGQMSKYETTNAQYCQFLNEAMATGDIIIDGNYVRGANGSNIGTDFPNELYYDLAGPGYTYDGAANGGAARINYSSGVFSVDSGFENHPVTYVSWYGATAFCNYYGYRLPTEWEWQAVADYDGSYIYGCGINMNNIIANYTGSTHPDGTTIVGAFGAYGYGICDLAGNIWEWTSSLYNDSYRSFRGGSWGSSVSGNAVSERGADTPSRAHQFMGFRVCR